jgi:hypothetical protein
MMARRDWGRLWSDWSVGDKDLCDQIFQFFATKTAKQRLFCVNFHCFWTDFDLKKTPRDLYVSVTGAQGLICEKRHCLGRVIASPKSAKRHIFFRVSLAECSRSRQRKRRGKAVFGCFFLDGCSVMSF